MYFVGDVCKRCLNAVTYVYEHSTIKLTNNS